jgi:cytochrome b561
MSDVKPDSYNAVSIGLHWLTVVLFVAAYSTIELRELFPKGSDARDAMKWCHESVGLSIFILAGLRLLIRLVARPRFPKETHPWLRALSGASHAALYLLMITLPLIGWIMLSADGKTIPFFSVNLPPLIARDENLAGQLEELHETIGTLGYWLIGLHASAALFHHYVLRDKTLWRMLPVRS